MTAARREATPATDLLLLSHPTHRCPPTTAPACSNPTALNTINAKTAQKHDYPSRAHRRSYNRRTAAERTFATLNDRSTNDLSRGWCRLFGLTPIALFTTTALIARNTRIADAFAARQADNQRRAANGLQPKQRKRRRHTTENLINAANAPPPEPAPLAA